MSSLAALVADRAGAGFPGQADTEVHGFGPSLSGQSQDAVSAVGCIWGPATFLFYPQANHLVASKPLSSISG